METRKETKKDVATKGFPSKLFIRIDKANDVYFIAEESLEEAMILDKDVIAIYSLEGADTYVRETEIRKK